MKRDLQGKMKREGKKRGETSGGRYKTRRVYREEKKLSRNRMKREKKREENVKQIYGKR